MAAAGHQQAVDDVAHVGQRQHGQRLVGRVDHPGAIQVLAHHAVHGLVEGGVGRAANGVERPGRVRLQERDDRLRQLLERRALESQKVARTV